MASLPLSTSPSLWQENTRVTPSQLHAFCRRWGLLELSLFGSVTRRDFNPHSDIDVLVTLDPQRQHGPWDWLEMIEELETLFDRKVDLTSHRILENRFRRRTILQDREVIYAA